MYNKISIRWQNFNSASRWNLIHLFAFLGLLIRVIVALNSEQVHQADEIFQYLEQAHRTVFGYGYIPWEYRFGTRSWILPGFISGFLYISKILGVDDPVFYVNFIKLIFCVISISLVYNAYIICREVVSENAGKIAAVFACFWYELIYFASKPSPEVLAAYLVIAALAIAVCRSNKFSSLMFGLFSALTIILRLQYIMPVSILYFYVMCKWPAKRIVLSIITLFAVICIAGYIDYLTWGEFFLSYYNNYVFNKVYNVGAIWGTSPFAYYFGALSICSMGIFCLVVCCSIFFLRSTWLFLLIAFSIIIPHSIIPHKEYRFIFLVIPVYLILLSIIINELFSYNLISKIIKILILLVFFAVSFAGLFNKLPYQYKICYKSIFLQDENLKSYLYLSKERDLHSILNIPRIWWDTGGYYYLHRNVPIYFLENFESINHKDYRHYVSHIICPIGTENIPGFKTIKRFKSIEIRKQVNSHAKYERLNIDTINVQQKGIDDKYSPNIKKG